MKFTLIEVVISIAILALSLTGLLQFLTQSQLQIGKADEKWREMHMLSVGAEYLLLAGNVEDLHVPDEIFPYPDYQLECVVEDADALPEELKDQSGQIPLKKWTIRLFKVSDRSEKLKVVIDRLGYEESENVSTQ